MKTFKNITVLLAGVLFIVGCKNDDNAQVYQEIPDVLETIEVENAAPTAAVLILPENNAELISKKPILTWDPASDPESETVTYDIYMGPRGGELALVSDNRINTDYEIETALDKGADYQWQVVSKDTKGNSTESAIFDFTTEHVTISLLTDNAPFSKRGFSSTTVFNGKIWLIGGEDASGNVLAEIWNSSDGTNWTLVTDTAEFGPRKSHATIVFNNKMWIYNGSNGSYLNNEIWSSEDGINWVKEENDSVWNTLPFYGQSATTMFVFENKIWRFAGYDGSTGDLTTERNIWNSSDGKNWTLVSENHGFDGKYGMEVIPFQGKLISLEGRSTASGSFNKIRQSIDGVNWDLVVEDLPFQMGFYSEAVVKDDKLFVTAGAAYSELWFTDNGLTWQKAVQERGYANRYAQSTVAFNNKIYVVGGGTFSDLYNDVWVID